MNSVLKSPNILKIISTVLDSHWNTDLAIRYITVEISKLVQRDVSFFKMNDDDKNKQLSMLSYEETYPNIVCKTIHELIRDVLDYVGIESQVVVATNTKVPLYALVVEGEKGKYFIDALNDLFKVQNNIQSTTYGNYNKSKCFILDTSDLITLSSDYIREMDLDLGIINTEYFSDYINRMRTILAPRNIAKSILMAQDSVDLLRKKTQFISDNYLNLYPSHGPYERVGLHVYFRNTLLDKGEKKSLRIGLSEDNHVIMTNEYGGHIFFYEEVKDDDKYTLKQKVYYKK